MTLQRNETAVKRQTKTPRTRAEEALAVADRKVKKLTVAEAKHRGAATATKAELEAAVRRRDHLAQSPDLPANHGEGGQGL